MTNDKTINMAMHLDRSQTEDESNGEEPGWKMVTDNVKLIFDSLIREMTLKYHNRTAVVCVRKKCSLHV